MDPTFAIHPADSRYAYKPVYRNKLHDMYVKARACMWHPEEINYSEDVIHYRSKLDENEKALIRYVFSVFSVIDILVNDNVANLLMKKIPYPEAVRFFQMQVIMESIHEETYQDQPWKILPRAEAEAVTDINRLNESVVLITNWISSYQQSPLAEIIARQICTEGIILQGFFAIVYWFKIIKEVFPGVAKANELISRDEAMHTEFLIELWHLQENKMKEEEVKTIVHQAVDTAHRSMRAAIPVDLDRMNSGLMRQYLESIADEILDRMGYGRPYDAKNPFSFMRQLDMPRVTNFFEKEVTEYSKMHYEKNEDEEDII